MIILCCIIWFIYVSDINLKIYINLKYLMINSGIIIVDMIVIILDCCKIRVKYC